MYNPLWYKSSTTTFIKTKAPSLFPNQVKKNGRQPNWQKYCIKHFESTYIVALMKAKP